MLKRKELIYIMVVFWLGAAGIAVTTAAGADWWQQWLPGPATPSNSNPPPAPDQVRGDIQPGVEPLTTGPVHEAFAEPVTLAAQENTIVPKAPPANIDEMVPDEKPEGENVVWIPGYWAWDADRGDFVWVSGLWRVPPPNMSWMPGYWTPVAGGFQWVPGFWSAEDVSQVDYLPAPPANLEQGPIGAPPSDDFVWVPGCQVWRGDRYVWRAGFWMQAQPDWCWVPASYINTPNGYLFVQGYWDLPLDRRGMLFAPVFFDRGVLARRGFVYSPSIVISADLLFANLFTCPRYHHYYFGDCYGLDYDRVGIFPCFEVRSHHDWYDPLFVHREWRERRTDRHWVEHLEREYKHRRDDVSARPPKTFLAEQAKLKTLPEAERQKAMLGQPLTTLASNKSSSIKFEKVGSADRELIKKQTKEFHQFRDQRQHWEVNAAGTGTPGGKGDKTLKGTLPKGGQTFELSPVPGGKLPSGEHKNVGKGPANVGGSNTNSVTIPKSPIHGKSAAVHDKGHAPPPLPAAPNAGAEGNKHKEREHH